MKTITYFDHAAATPVDERVLAAMLPYYAERYFNPSATYLAARGVSDELNAARASVAHWLGSRPAEIIFTAGGTEANNLAIHGVMRQFLFEPEPQSRRPEGNVVISSIEHDSILQPAHQYDCREVPVGRDGTIDLAALEAAIDDQTVLVSIIYASNEIGTVQPLRDVAAIIEKKRAARLPGSRHPMSDIGHPKSDLPLYLHTDACQAANYLDLHAARLGVDMLTINGGKIYGPKQSGALYVSGRTVLQPLIQGGGQERNLRSGTENVAACIGLAKALDIAQTMRHEESRRLNTLQQQAFKLIAEQLPTAIINGSKKHRLPNNIHLTLPGQDNERLLMELDQRGILAAAGSACSASSDEPSHVLKALGLSDADAQSSLRFTMGRATTIAELETVIDTLRQLSN